MTNTTEEHILLARSPSPVATPLCGAAARTLTGSAGHMGMEHGFVGPQPALRCPEPSG